MVRLCAGFMIALLLGWTGGAAAEESAPVERITLRLKNADFGEVIRSLESLTGYQFVVDPNASMQSVTINQEQILWDVAVRQILADQNLAYWQAMEVVYISERDRLAQMGLYDARTGETTPLRAQPEQEGEDAFPGERISVDYKKADLHVVARELAQTQEDVVIELSPRLGGFVTMQLDDVPWTLAARIAGLQSGLISSFDGTTLSFKLGRRVRRARPTLPPIRGGGANDLELLARRTKKYSGTPVTLNLKSADFNDVIAYLADVTGFNIVVSPKVQSKPVSVALNEVPWDQALDLILRQQDLRAEIEGNVIYIKPE